MLGHHASWFVAVGVAAGFLSLGLSAAVAEEFGQGKRRSLLKIETTDLPQRKVVIQGGERLHPPGARTPWHTSGPKLFYVLDGTLAVEGLDGQTLLTCGPAPKLCLSSHKLWFIRNPGQGALKFVIIGVDAVESPTIHEEVGQVARISGDRVTLAVGDVLTSDLAVPRREITITVGALGPIAVGDDVVTVRHNEKDHKADSLVKLARRWQ